ncbi:RNaseH domain-containing protein [Deinococcus sonorensis]|uniref:RNaseH domain-containing protein n=2 Tax=Deinococcus sonorensis TaxID=309891 RepID=A0AAU7UFT4_9DEIO
MPKRTATPAAPVVLKPMAFAFEHTQGQIHLATEVAWTPEAHMLVKSMSSDLYTTQKKNLPTQDLRMTLQIRDAGVIRTDTSLGTKDSSTVAFTRTDVTGATAAANAAAADWALGTLMPLVEPPDPQGKLMPGRASELRKLALNGKAMRAREERMAVLSWETNRQTGTAKVPYGSRQYAALADHVADLIEGHEIYPGRGPMRRAIRRDLTSNEVDLMTDVITLPHERGYDVRFSLGLTVSVETYPGRKLPIIKLHHRKFVWARTPTAGREKLSGYVLPGREARALRFELSKDLELGRDYALLADTYGLPNLTSAQHLAMTGVYGEHWVMITHKNGRAETEAAMTGVTDLDRRDSFARVADLVAPFGLTPWTGLQRIETTSRSETDLDGGWAGAFGTKKKKVKSKKAPSLFGEPAETDTTPEAVDPKKAATALRTQQDKLSEWATRMQANIDAHYGGTHQIVIAYGKNLHDQAAEAERILRTVLKSGATILLKRLPDAVHGRMRDLPGEELSKPGERAKVRAQAWKPFIDILNAHQKAHPEAPIQSVLILADRWYDGVHDDVINKRVARTTLNAALGVTVQYLLPIRTRRGTSVPDEDAMNDFRMRTMNAWRDLAWKGLGKMDGIEEKSRELIGTADRPVLGLGIIRVNRKKRNKNDASFVPYAIELDPVTGACSGAVLLGKGDSDPTPTAFLPLPQLLRALSEYGPSILAREKKASETNKARQAATQKFMANILIERTKVHPRLIVLADAETLNGNWSWLNDANVNPNDITLAGQDHFEGNCPDAAFIRIRQDVSPKVVRDAPKVRIIENGVEVPAAVWSDADLYRVTDASDDLQTYLSFGSKIIQRPRGISSHRPVQEAGASEPRGPYLDAYQTPNPIDVTVIRSGGLDPDDLARFVEALRREFAHFGSWIIAPGPLHFASALKEYIPDYDLSDEDEEAAQDQEDTFDPGSDRLF